MHQYPYHNRQLFWSHSHTTFPIPQAACYIVYFTLNLQHVYTQTYGQQMVSSHPEPLRMGASLHVRVLVLHVYVYIVKEHLMAMVGTHFGLLLLHSQLRQLLQEGRGPGEWLEAHGSYMYTCVSYLSSKCPWALEVHRPKTGVGHLHGKALCRHTAYLCEPWDHQKWGVGG